MKKIKGKVAKHYNELKKAAFFLAYLFLSTPLMAVDKDKQGLESINTTLAEYMTIIKQIIGTILAIVFIVGIVHVVIAKSDRDPERFKKLIMNYVVAMVFVLVALGMVSIVQTSFSSPTQ